MPDPVAGLGVPDHLERDQGEYDAGEYAEGGEGRQLPDRQREQQQEDGHDQPRPVDRADVAQPEGQVR